MKKCSGILDYIKYYFALSCFEAYHIEDYVTSTYDVEQANNNKKDIVEILNELYDEDIFNMGNFYEVMENFIENFTPVLLNGFQVGEIDFNWTLKDLEGVEGYSSKLREIFETLLSSRHNCKVAMMNPIYIFLSRCVYGKMTMPLLKELVVRNMYDPNRKDCYGNLNTMPYWLTQNFVNSVVFGNGDITQQERLEILKYILENNSEIDLSITNENGDTIPSTTEYKLLMSDK